MCGEGRLCVLCVVTPLIERLLIIMPNRPHHTTSFVQCPEGELQKRKEVVHVVSLHEVRAGEREGEGKESKGDVWVWVPVCRAWGGYVGVWGVCVWCVCM